MKDATHPSGTIRLPEYFCAQNLLNTSYLKDAVLSDIQQDLDSFTFGLSELSMLIDEQSELNARIILLHKCVEDAKSKVDNLIKMNKFSKLI
jgi:hypothetical protein